MSAVPAPDDVRRRGNLLIGLAVGLTLVDVFVLWFIGLPMLGTAAIASAAALLCGLYGFGIRYGAVWAVRWLPAAARQRPDVVAYFWHDEQCPGCAHPAGEGLAFCGNCGHAIRAPKQSYFARAKLAFARLLRTQPPEPARTAAYRRRAVHETSDKFLWAAIGTLVGGWILTNTFGSVTSFGPIIVTVGVFVPPALAVLWLRRQDRFEPEPKTMMFLAMGWGVLCGVFVMAANGLVIRATGWYGIAGITEELAKGAGLVIFAAHPILRKEMNGPTDGLVYGACVGLGFAAMENFGYVMQSAADGALLDGFIIRSGGIIAHMMYTGLTGAFIGLMVLRKGTASPGDLLAGFLPGAMLHMLHNSSFDVARLVASAPETAFIVSLFIVLAGSGLSSWWFFKTLGESLRDEATWGFTAGQAPVEGAVGVDVPPS